MIEITEENIGDYTISDVIFPIIGHKVPLPTNPDMKKIMEELMAKDGVTMAMFNHQSSILSTSASGSYRKIVTHADDIQYDIVEVANTNQELLSSNYLTESDPTPVIPEGTDEATISKALRLRFSLKPSSYATMFMREVTRTSSAFNVQHKLSMNNA